MVKFRFLLLDYHSGVQLGMWEMLHPLRIHMVSYITLYKHRTLYKHI